MLYDPDLIRRTSSELNEQNPLLEDGQKTFEVDTLISKIGNGVDNYVDLPGFKNYNESYGLTGPTGINEDFSFISPPKIPDLEIGVKKGPDRDNVVYRIPNLELGTNFKYYNPKIYLFRRKFNNKTKYIGDPLSDKIIVNKTTTFNRPKNYSDSIVKLSGVSDTEIKRYTIFNCDVNIRRSWGDSFPIQLPVNNGNFSISSNVDEWLVGDGELSEGTGITMVGPGTLESPSIPVPSYDGPDSDSKFVIPIKFSEIIDPDIEIVIFDSLGSEISSFEISDIGSDIVYLSFSNSGDNNPSFDTSSVSFEISGSNFTIEKVGADPEFQIGRVSDTSIYEWRDLEIIEDLSPHPIYTSLDPSLGTSTVTTGNKFDSVKIKKDWYHVQNTIPFKLSASGSGKKANSQYFKFAIGIEYRGVLFFGNKTRETLKTVRVAENGIALDIV